MSARETRMSSKKKIIDNPSLANTLDQINALEGLATLYRNVPYIRELFPNLEEAFGDLPKIRMLAEKARVPDQFNERFACLGWIAYESMNMDAMQSAISIYDSKGSEAAENFLAEFYDETFLNWNMMRFKGDSHFRRRIRLVELAKDDYLAGRYHACIPLLLCMLDGLVNDISKHVGFFAESVDMTAWDCIAAHESGLQTLVSVLTQGKNKTNEAPITIPYRHGILHGRELAFDNKIVAAKTWAALFATRDWATTLADGKKTVMPKNEVSWYELRQQLLENERQKNLLDLWRPRLTGELSYLPFSGDSTLLPMGTPERAVASFIENWISRRYGLVAESLVYFTDSTDGKKAGIAKDDFGRHVPIDYKVISIDDHAAAITLVDVELKFKEEDGSVVKRALVRTIYQDDKNNALIRTDDGGRWKIFQHSFINIL